MSVLDPLYYAVAWVIMWVHGGLGVVFGAASGLSWALTIAIFVVLVRLLLLPLSIKPVKSQRKMQLHRLQLKEMRKRYKNDRQQLNDWTMEFYKKNNINPLVGGWLLAAQLLAFLGLFGVLRSISAGQSNYGLTPTVV